jgi:hypothetical protein
MIEMLEGAIKIGIILVNTTKAKTPGLIKVI